ncbi:MAG: hypothetical protein WCV88_00505 [Patescibacteria group bacterium]|jgi:hypothetical protein
MTSPFDQLRRTEQDPIKIGKTLFDPDRDMVETAWTDMEQALGKSLTRPAPDFDLLNDICVLYALCGRPLIVSPELLQQAIDRELDNIKSVIKKHKIDPTSAVRTAEFIRGVRAVSASTDTLTESLPVDVMAQQALNGAQATLTNKGQFPLYEIQDARTLGMKDFPDYLIGDAMYQQVLSKLSVKPDSQDVSKILQWVEEYVGMVRIFPKLVTDLPLSNIDAKNINQATFKFRPKLTKDIRYLAELRALIDSTFPSTRPAPLKIINPSDKAHDQAMLDNPFAPPKN